ncbi:uncharacterized protein TRAVEDRAFT_132523, partial [Trametes versicolor FP-101664 SS1]|uniref:uncharacterized protein n=1 Tax=Trametes versicolor (strain FP-101664) TaxID=717944 RepID=UPI00046221A7
TAENMLYPEVCVCTNPHCNHHGQLLRMWDLPTRVQVFTLTKGAYDTYSVQLTCKGCHLIYYPNYVVIGSVCQYYIGIPDFIQVSGHKYIARDMLEHFTTLSVLSWNLSTNTAHIYHESMSRLNEDSQKEPRFHLRPCHTSDGFYILALLHNA